VAKPNGRTSHIVPTPNLGGIAVFAAVSISLLIFTGFTTAQEMKYIAAGMLVLMFVGLKDDLHPLPAYKKFIGQSIAALIILLAGDLRLHSLHGLFGINEISFFAGIIITWILAMTLINSFNLIDGIDGLASGIGILASLFFGIVFLECGQLSYAIISFSLAMSLLTFFYFNVFSTKNKIFLGDSGSMLIGLLLSILVVRFLNMENSMPFFHQNNSSPAVLLSILIVPLFDTARVFVVRISRGGSPFVADKKHIHHHMLLLSGTHLSATRRILMANLLFIAVPLMWRSLNGEVLILVILAMAVVLFNIPVYLNKLNQKYNLDPASGKLYWADLKNAYLDAS
jgi:UDP-N-acetylmuramyl pentapeptide phosphotransferase/UDP-N-acetylglucosamine-1-phosphate transferase